MKKSSAFSVFSSKNGVEKKGKKIDTPKGPKDAGSTNLKRAGSTPSVGKGKKLLNSIRASVRGSGQKERPSTLKTKGESPHVAVDSGRQVSLTSLKIVPDSCCSERASRKPKPTVDQSSKPSLLSLKTEIATQANGHPAVQTDMVSATVSQLLPLPASLNRVKGTKRQLTPSAEPGPSSKKKRKSARSTPVQKAVAADHDEDNPADCALGVRQLPYMFDSSAEASRMFDVLIHPVTTDKFFKELWEQKPLLVKRHMPDYNRGWFSTAEFDRILRQENIQFGINIDITTYVDDKRETHNPDGRAYAPVVWDFYQKGCSVRFLNPHTYSRNVWKILSVLQEFFNCSVGANVYLTPPGTQGFAPHYDDIEAFVIQLEGKKHWKLYNPRSDEETLPRFSSKNFSKNDVGTPILDVVLEAGDLLYFPRGYVHQAFANDNEHSLHITFSCCQRNTWGDLLEKLLPQALASAFEENIEYRRGLPLDYLNYMGIVHQGKESSQRKNFEKKIESLVRSLVNYLPLDAACDQMGKQVIHDALPPVITQSEKSCSIHGAGERWDPAEAQVRGVVELEPDTRVRIIRHGVLRMLTEEDEVRIYHSLENARVYHGNVPQYIEISSEMAPAVEYLIEVYPEFVPIDCLPLEHDQDKVVIANILYDKGLLMTEEPLQTMYDEGTDSDGDVTVPC